MKKYAWHDFTIDISYEGKNDKNIFVKDKTGHPILKFYDLRGARVVDDEKTLLVYSDRVGYVINREGTVSYHELDKDTYYLFPNRATGPSILIQLDDPK